MRAVSRFSQASSNLAPISNARSATPADTAAASSSGTRPATASSAFSRFNLASLSSAPLSDAPSAADTAASTSTDDRPKSPFVKRLKSTVRPSTSNSASSFADDQPVTASLLLVVQVFYKSERPLRHQGNLQITH